ncbi:hypothetical protein HPT29_024895 (plasmid) [Microvirga terrae]|uniref:DUF6894 domain-containing protein n=1 Tax=Microvirga terrae TaxID=2740529 RepID=A0ABY5RYQ9_9HYPH|nr:hypothetical protein [Microvirga terrae]UVF22398.1 hypothetical protein HPT29_024895 [Microvirga terrae]
MPRYFLHLRYPASEDGFARDDEGDEIPDHKALRQHVIETARDLMRGARLKAIPEWLQCTFEVTDESGTVVLTLPFSDAVQ